MENITSKDIFTNSFVAMQSAASTSSIIEVVISLLVSFLIGSFIFFIYKKTFNGVLYQRSFNISLIVIAMVLTLVIMIIKGNLVLSLGMVGALSIVRFRTPVKDPTDLVFIFWSIAVGIANGVSFFHISVVGSIMISIVLLILSKKRMESDNPYLLVIKTNKDGKSQDLLTDKIKSSVKTSYLKSKTVMPDACEIIYEVRISDNETSFLNDLQKDKEIKQATLITYSGDLAAN